VRQRIDAIFETRYSGEFLNMAVPFLDVLVANRPIYSKSIASRTFKIKIRPTLDLPGPKKGFSSHLISPDPVKGLLLHVRVFGVFHKKVHRILTEGIAAADHRIFVLNLLWNLTTMLKLVRK